MVVAFAIVGVVHDIIVVGYSGSVVGHKWRNFSQQRSGIRH